MAKYGYGRVSTKGQRLYGNSLKEQKELLLKAGVLGERIFVDTYTGTKMERPQLDKLLCVLQDGDELVVCKLDRFARTAAEGSMLIRDLVERGIRVNILNMGVADNRSEEHTSELQSRPHLVCRLLLEKKKNRKNSTM